MEFPAWLSAQLSELTEVLDDPATDLQAILAVLIDDVTVAVPSFLGLRMTLRGGRGTRHCDRNRPHRRPNCPVVAAPAAGPAGRCRSGQCRGVYTGNADAFAVGQGQGSSTSPTARSCSTSTCPAAPRPMRRPWCPTRSGQAAVIHRAIGCLTARACHRRTRSENSAAGPRQPAAP